MRQANEKDPLITTTVSNGSSSSNNYHILNDSKRSCCQEKRGVPFLFCFALAAILFGAAVIFKHQFGSIFDEKDPRSQTLYERYEQDWTTLEHIEKRFIPEGWKFDTKCDESHFFDLTFAVKLENTDSYVM